MRRLLVTLLALTVALAGCVDTTDTPTPDDGNGASNGGTPGNGGGEPPELAFEGARALELAVEQVIREDGSVRYRVPGTDGNREAAHLIAGHLADANLTVGWHHFNATYGCEETAMHNVVGVLEGNPERTFYLGAHYDSRPIAEKDPDPEKRDAPIQGANDGASGVGVLLELARVLAEREWDATLVFVFFDGEDGGEYEGSACTDWILGSTAFVRDMTEDEVARAQGMILLDMVGDADAVFPREGHSNDGRNRPLGNAVWSVAGGMGFERFTNTSSYRITDDHVPFIDAGIPAIDVIDLRTYPQVFTPTHHTHADTVDNLSADTMHEVGLVLERYLVERFAR